MKCVFLELRNQHASKEGDGHIFAGASIPTLLGQILKAKELTSLEDGIDTFDWEWRNENFGDYDRDKIFDTDVLGVSLIGPTYIPAAIQVIKTRVKSGTIVLLGGQPINLLNSDQFNKFFCFRNDITVLNGNQDRNVIQALNLPQPILKQEDNQPKLPTTAEQLSFAFDKDLSRIHLKVYSEQSDQDDDQLMLPPAQEASSIPAWESLSEHHLRAYFQDEAGRPKEMAFYLSQNCAFNCNFCLASKGKEEEYRDLDVAEKDLEWLATKAKAFGLPVLRLYLSNLDIFQSPKLFKDFCKKVIQVKERTAMKIEFRGLATMQNTLRRMHFLDLIFAQKAGLTTIAVGMDGFDKKVWKSQNKGHNGHPEDGEKVIRMLNELFTVEILMVSGFSQETDETFAKTLAFCERMRDLGIIIRTHSAQENVIQFIKEHEHDPIQIEKVEFHMLPEDPNSKEAKRLLILYTLDPRAVRPIYPNNAAWQAWAAKQGTTVENLNKDHKDR